MVNWFDWKPLPVLAALSALSAVQKEEEAPTTAMLPARRRRGSALRSLSNDAFDVNGFIERSESG